MMEKIDIHMVVRDRKHKYAHVEEGLNRARGYGYSSPDDM